MDPTRATLTLSNPVHRELAALEAPALADTGAMHLCIPEHVALQLQLAEQEKREVRHRYMDFGAEEAKKRKS